jgi:hypothetical protein
VELAQPRSGCMTSGRLRDAWPGRLGKWDARAKDTARAQTSRASLLGSPAVRGERWPPQQHRLRTEISLRGPAVSLAARKRAQKFT